MPLKEEGGIECIRLVRTARSRTSRFGSRQNKGPRHQDVQTPELEDLKKLPSSSNQPFAT
ncbi:hypothetical protein GE21DRAFT_1207074 [Neurospora crassa]|nr:hypothetical protein GE21DRAFT_1207074 [Neurospora crassa]